MKRSKLVNEKGFTLVELVIAISILGVLSVLTYGIIAMNVKTFRTVTDNTVSCWDLRETLNKIKYDLREIDPTRIIGNNKLSSDALSFTTIDGHIFRFKVDGDKLVRKYDDGSWKTLIEGLRTEPFIYLDGNLKPTNSRTDLQYINVRLKTIKNDKVQELHEIIYVRN